MVFPRVATERSCFCQDQVKCQRAKQSEVNRNDWSPPMERSSCRLAPVIARSRGRAGRVKTAKRRSAAEGSLEATKPSPHNRNAGATSAANIFSS